MPTGGRRKKSKSRRKTSSRRGRPRKTRTKGKIVRRKGYYRRTKSGKRVYVRPSYVSRSRLTSLQKKVYSRKNKYKRPKTRKEIGLRCKKGEIPRAGYYRRTKSGKRVYVKPKCIKDQGKPGKAGDVGIVVIPAKPMKGLLKKYGWSAKKGKVARHVALDKLMRDLRDPGYLRHYLNLLAQLNKSRIPIYRILRDDFRYAGKYYRIY